MPQPAEFAAPALVEYADDTLVNKATVCKLLHCSSQILTRYMQEGLFVRPIPTLSPTRPRWLRAKVAAWFAWNRPDADSFDRMWDAHCARAGEVRVEEPELVCA